MKSTPGELYLEATRVLKTEVANPNRRLRKQSWTRPMTRWLCTGHLLKPIANEFAYLIRTLFG
jgi:hypothetical protein